MKKVEFNKSSFPWFSLMKRRIRMILSLIRDVCNGVDFTLPDRMYDRGREDGAMYYATPDGILKEIFRHINPEEYPHFLDIGCGKGFVLWKAWEYGFHHVGGVEYDQKLVSICKANMRKLGLENVVHPVCCDACSYEDYGSYDVFYFFNPFSGSIMNKVIQRIVEQCRGKKITIIYFRPRYIEAIEATGLFDLKKCFFDKGTGYTAHIYQGTIPV